MAVNDFRTHLSHICRACLFLYHFVKLRGSLFRCTHTHTAKSQLLSLTSRCCPQTSAIELLVLHRSEPRPWVSQVFQLLAQHELPLQAPGV